MSRAAIGIAESVEVVNGETIAKVRLGAPTDADVELARRAMVEAHQTMLALRDARDTPHADGAAGGDAFLKAHGAYLTIKLARGGE